MGSDRRARPMELARFRMASPFVVSLFAARPVFWGVQCPGDAGPAGGVSINEVNIRAPRPRAQVPTGDGARRGDRSRPLQPADERRPRGSGAGWRRRGLHTVGSSLALPLSDGDCGPIARRAPDCTVGWRRVARETPGKGGLGHRATIAATAARHLAGAAHDRSLAQRSGSHLERTDVCVRTAL